MKQYYLIVGFLVYCLLSSCGGTHGNVGKYWVQGTPDEVYDLLQRIASDSAGGIRLVENDDYGAKPYLRVVITSPGYAIKGITVVVSPPIKHDGLMGCWIGIAFIQRKGGYHCSSGTCESAEIAQGQQAADQFLISPLRRSMRVEFLDSWF